MSTEAEPTPELENWAELSVEWMKKATDRIDRLWKLSQKQNEAMLHLSNSIDCLEKLQTKRIVALEAETNRLWAKIQVLERKVNQ